MHIIARAYFTYEVRPRDGQEWLLILPIGLIAILGSAT